MLTQHVLTACCSKYVYGHFDSTTLHATDVSKAVAAFFSSIFESICSIFIAAPDLAHMGVLHRNQGEPCNALKNSVIFVQC